MSPAETLQRRFEDLTTLIEQAMEDVAAGKPPAAGLQKLDHDVALLCGEVRKAGPETAKAMQQPMGRMISRLDELADSITAFKERLKNNG